ncbi:MAG: hypothetical protein AAF581_13470 [Planctomycetota bacterium]
MSKPVPTFCNVVFIIDLCLCALRIPLAAISVFGWIAMQSQPESDPMLQLAPWEVISGFGIGIFGTIGYIGLLLKRRWGVALIYLMLLFCVMSLVVGIMSAPLIVENMQQTQEMDEQTERAMAIGAQVGVWGTAGFRVMLMALALAAVVKFQRWFDRREEELADDFA